MAISTEFKDGTLKIFLKERFNFSLVEEFRSAYIDLKPKAIVVDFAQSDYMDSSGLGMLLNMRREFDDHLPISLINCNQNIKKVLIISRFETYFKIV